MWGHSVEGQSASRPVRIHYHSGRACRGETYGCTTIVPANVTTITIKAPGLVVCSKPAVTLSSPCDSSVCHSYSNMSFPLNFPITAASQTLSALTPGVKSVGVIRI